MRKIVDRYLLECISILCWCVVYIYTVLCLFVRRLIPLDYVVVVVCGLRSRECFDGVWV
jgi:hypothetical protein